MDTVVKGDHLDCQLLTIMADVIAMSLNVVNGRCYSYVTLCCYGRSCSHDCWQKLCNRFVAGVFPLFFLYIWWQMLDIIVGRCCARDFVADVIAIITVAKWGWCYYPMWRINSRCYSQVADGTATEWYVFVYGRCYCHCGRLISHWG